MDVSTLTDEELTQLRLDAEAERQKRSTAQRLTDAAWNLVTEARNLGYTQAQVAKVLTQVVTDAYK